MSLVTLDEVKLQANLTDDDAEFYPKITQLIPVAQNKVINFLNRRVFDVDSLPEGDELLTHDMEVTEDIKHAIGAVIINYMESDNSFNSELLEDLLTALVGSYRVISV